MSVYSDSRRLRACAGSSYWPKRPIRLDLGDERRVLRRFDEGIDQCTSYPVRQSARGVEAHDEIEAVHRNALFRQGRNIGQFRQPLGRRRDQSAELASLEHGRARGVGHHADIDLAAEDGRGELCAALERHGDHGQFEVVRQRLHAQRRHGADAGRRVIELSRIAVNVVDDVVERSPRRVRAYGEHADVGCIVAQQNKIIERERHRRSGNASDGEYRIDSLSDGVAVGLGRRDVVHAHGPTGARSIEQHDGLSKRRLQRRRDHARRGVDRTAGSRRDDHLNRTRRKWLLRPSVGGNRHRRERGTAHGKRELFH